MREQKSWKRKRKSRGNRIKDILKEKEEEDLEAEVMDLEEEAEVIIDHKDHLVIRRFNLPAGPVTRKVT